MREFIAALLVGLIYGYVFCITMLCVNVLFPGRSIIILDKWVLWKGYGNRSSRCRSGPAFPGHPDIFAGWKELQYISSSHSAL